MATAAVLSGVDATFEVTEVDVGEPGPGEVRVRIAGTGVCHTDQVVREGTYPYEFPAVLGHEGAGVVEAVGPGVTGIEAGDRVVLSFNSCGRCRPCLSGHPAYCDDFFFLNFGGRRHDGSTAFSRAGEPVGSHFFGQSSFASTTIASSRSVVKVRDDVDLALLGPLGCGIQTGAGTVLNALDPEPGASVAVFGAGAVGLSGLLAAVVAGATTIVAVDLHDERLALAGELGATHTVSARRPGRRPPGVRLPGPAGADGARRRGRPRHRGVARGGGVAGQGLAGADGRRGRRRAPGLHPPPGRPVGRRPVPLRRAGAHLPV